MYNWRKVQITKLLVMQFSPPSRHLIPPRFLDYISYSELDCLYIQIAGQQHLQVNEYNNPSFAIHCYMRNRMHSPNIKSIYRFRTERGLYILYILYLIL
jgi:hypothetical protein